MFFGAAALSLDAKGRLAIPARHREALLAAANGTLVLTAHPHRCLLLYPNPAWEPIRDKVLAAPSLDPRSAAIKRLLVGFARDELTYWMERCAQQSDEIGRLKAFIDHRDDPSGPVETFGIDEVRRGRPRWRPVEPVPREPVPPEVATSREASEPAAAEPAIPESLATHNGNQQGAGPGGPLAGRVHDGGLGQDDQAATAIVLRLVSD